MKSCIIIFHDVGFEVFSFRLFFFYFFFWFENFCFERGKYKKYLFSDTFFDPSKRLNSELQQYWSCFLNKKWRIDTLSLHTRKTFWSSHLDWVVLSVFIFIFSCGQNRTNSHNTNDVQIHVQTYFSVESIRSKLSIRSNSLNLGEFWLHE